MNHIKVGYSMEQCFIKLEKNVKKDVFLYKAQQQ